MTNQTSSSRIEYISLGVEHSYYVAIFGNTVNIRGFAIKQVQPFIPDPGTMTHSFLVLVEREANGDERHAWKALVRHADLVDEAIELQRKNGWALDCRSRKFSDLSGEKNVILVFSQPIDERSLDCKDASDLTEA